MQPLIHIGYQKTGTSFLQKNIFSHSSVFSAPWGTVSTDAIEYFVLYHRSRFEPKKVRCDFEKSEKASGLTPIISHEDLSGYPIYGRYYGFCVADRIKETFPNAKILIGIREQNSMILSQYFQYVRQGGTRKLEYLISCGDSRKGFRPVLRLDHFEYDLLILKYQKLFGIENVLVLPIELLVVDQNTYFENLFSFLDIKVKFEIARERVHQRRSKFGMELERQSNRFIRRPDIPPKDYKDYPLIYRAKNRFIRIFDEHIGRTLEKNVPQGSYEKFIGEYVGNYYVSSNVNTKNLISFDLNKLGYK